MEKVSKCKLLPFAFCAVLLFHQGVPYHFFPMSVENSILSSSRAAAVFLKEKTQELKVQVRLAVQVWTTFSWDLEQIDPLVPHQNKMGKYILHALGDRCVQTKRNLP